MLDLQNATIDRNTNNVIGRSANANNVIGPNPTINFNATPSEIGRQLFQKMLDSKAQYKEMAKKKMTELIKIYDETGSKDAAFALKNKYDWIRSKKYWKALYKIDKDHLFEIIATTTWNEESLRRAIEAGEAEKKAEGK